MVVFLYFNIYKLIQMGATISGIYSLSRVLNAILDSYIAGISSALVLLSVHTSSLCGVGLCSEQLHIPLPYTNTRVRVFAFGSERNTI